MKRIVMFFLTAVSVFTADSQVTEPAKDSFYVLTPVEVRSVRAGENDPFTKSNISRKEIEKINLGQDIPFLLNQTPGVVVNSDAGNAVGYTGIRIRGTDATRINVTLNGIPYNDAESQGTFFVDLPDFSSSAGSIQVQRGVGTSSNGAGAFGANIHLSTNEVINDPYLEINNSFGSFQTFKNTLKGGTGLKNKLSSDFRISRISSEGYIDRASSRLSSLYFSQAFVDKGTSIRFNFFTGKEKTYQAWYGISESDLRAGNRTVNYAGTAKPGTPYPNETDNYTQTHYQLFFNQRLGQRIQFSNAFFLTKGNGYYEQYKADESYASYNLPFPVNGTDTTFRSDFIRQLWLDNDFYGSIFSFQYKHRNTQATLGGGYTVYKGDHFGKVIWASEVLTGTDNWYDLDADKKDFNLYLKQLHSFANKWHLFLDVQYRHVDYRINGFRNNPGLQSGNLYHFLNPKAGISYSGKNWKSYLSYSIANKEPNRDDFEAGQSLQPRPEQLRDLEWGIEYAQKKYSWGASIYYMNYKDQLVLTGKINDVGAYTRTNIAKSYRAGIEIQGAVKFSDWFNAGANLALSRNRVLDFSEFIDDYDNGGQKVNTYRSTAIAYSPAAVGSASLNFLPLKKLELRLLSKYVSKQYLDNTENEQRVLDAFFVQDLQANYAFQLKGFKEITLIARVNNLLNRKYEPNGYTYSYIYGGTEITENFYFPMAGIHFMMGVNLRL